MLCIQLLQTTIYQQSHNDVTSFLSAEISADAFACSSASSDEDSPQHLSPPCLCVHLHAWPSHASGQHFEGPSSQSFEGAAEAVAACVLEASAEEASDQAAAAAAHAASAGLALLPAQPLQPSGCQTPFSCTVAVHVLQRQLVREQRHSCLH